MGNIIGIAGILSSILIIMLIVMGLWKSIIHSFKPGVYFFILLIIYEIYTIIAPPLMRNYFDGLTIENENPMMGMTLGELVAFSLTLIPKMVLLAAFICLIYGLRGLLNLKSSSPEK